MSDRPFISVGNASFDTYLPIKAISRCKIFMLTGGFLGYVAKRAWPKRGPL